MYDDLQSLDSKKSYEEVKSFFLDATEVGELFKERMEKLNRNYIREKLLGD